MADKSQTTDPYEKYRGPDADAKAAKIKGGLGTDDETLVDVVWLLRYTTVKHHIQWPTIEELMLERRGCEDD